MKPALLSFDDALTALMARAGPVAGHESVRTQQANGRVVAAALVSSLNVPPMDNTQMDGYALRTADLAAGGRLRVAQRIPAGQVGQPLQPGTAARIFTGAMIPDGADAVVMQEMADVQGDDVLIKHRPAPGEWIRQTGEDIRAGSVILPVGTRLTPQACGLAASVGLAGVEVYRRVRVACFFTGDELAMPGEPLRPGAIYNSNRFVLVSLLQQLGCVVEDLGIVPDSLAATRAALRKAALANDLIVTVGGMSVGEEDHVKPAVLAEGELDLWQIAIKPGKPLAYGTVRRPPAADEAGGTCQPASVSGTGQPVSAHFIGLPGNPVSAFVTFLMFVRPFLLRLQGMERVEPRRFTLRADFSWPKPDKRREFLRARINAEGGLELFANQGSAVLTSTVWGDGLIDNPSGHVIVPGDPVRFLSFADLLAG